VRKELADKYERLKEILSGLESAVVAFSGGADSTLLLKAAADALGENALAVTAASEVHPSHETEESREIARTLGVRQIIMEMESLAIDAVRENRPDRCYHCKKALFERIREIADTEGIRHIVHGENASDEDDFRPGRRAAKELDVKSPLCDALLSGDEIRELSKELGLPTAAKPPTACLATRFPYHTEITAEKLRRVDAAEHVLRSKGFPLVRVRDHGGLARIEVAKEELARFADGSLRGEVRDALCKLGYTHVTIDLAGYRTGGMDDDS
jgi:uncharacterized protein